MSEDDSLPEGVYKLPFKGNFARERAETLYDEWRALLETRGYNFPERIQQPNGKFTGHRYDANTAFLLQGCLNVVKQYEGEEPVDMGLLTNWEAIVPAIFAGIELAFFVGQLERDRPERVIELLDNLRFFTRDDYFEHLAKFDSEEKAHEQGG